MDSISKDKMHNQQVELQRLISRISSSIVLCAYADLDEEIEKCLALIAQFTHSDRSYLFLMRDDRTADNTHEWCADGIVSQKEALQGLEMSLDYPLAKQLFAQQIIFYPDVINLPRSHGAEKEILLSQGIQSLLIVPMVSKTRIVGFIGLDAVKTKRDWSNDEIDLLKISGEMFTHALEHKKTEELLIASESRLRYVFERIPAIAVQGYDVNRRVFLWNQASELLYGYSQEEALGQSLEDLIIPPELKEFVIQSHQQWLTQDEDIPSEEITLLHKDGTERQVFSSHVMHTTVHGEKELYCVDVDLTPLKQAQEALEKLAHYDSLTNLPNRILLSDRLNRMISISKRNNHLVAVAYLDLDGFKQINDSLGHNMGDLALQQLSIKMRQTLRDEDTLARIGGDEFVAILGGLQHLEDVHPVLQRLLDAASTPIQIDGHLLKVSASIGVTLYPLDDAEPDQLMRHADQAMYLAKQAGKDRYHLFDIQLECAIRHKQQILKQIDDALKNNEFVLYFQPKINMQSLAFEGAEVLIRWQHPEQGLIPPAAFLPLLDGHHLELALGAWVMENALQQLSQWQQQGFICPLSINIAAKQIQRIEFVDEINNLLSRFPQINPQFVELEILETSALDDIDLVIQILSESRALGVTIALDDFGTGYSSLAYLKRLPVDCLKIDQTFVRDMLADPDDLSIIEGILGLAKAFNLKVIAEGVETLAHCRELLQLNCFSGQGYGIAKPMPAEALPQWVKNQLPRLIF